MQFSFLAFLLALVQALISGDLTALFALLGL